MNAQTVSNQGLTFGDTMRAWCLWSAYDKIGEGGAFEIELKKLCTDELGSIASPYHVRRALNTMVAMEWMRIGYHDKGKRRMRYYAITQRGCIALLALIPTLGGKADAIQGTILKQIAIGGAE